MIVHPHPKFYGGLLSSQSNIEFYQFTLTGSQLVDLGLLATFGNVTLLLLDATGATLASSTAGASTDAAISLRLDAGTYTIAVASGSDAAYALQVQTGSPAVGTSYSDGAGNRATAARPIGVLGVTPHSFADWVGMRDQDDYYAFNLAGPATVRVSLAGLVHDAVLYLRNASDQQVGYARATPMNGGSIVMSLAAGVYYIDVQAAGITAATDTGYNLTVSSASLADTAGNTLATSRSLGIIGAAGRVVSGTLGPFNKVDDYGFILAGPSSISLTLSGLTNGANLSLLNAAGRVVASGSASTTHGSSIVAQLVAGSYYVAVQGGNATPYTLGLTAASQPVSGGTAAATAQAIGTLGTTPVTLASWVGPIDPAAWYGFTLSGAATLTLALSTWTGMVAGAAGVTLFDAAGHTLATASAGPAGAGSVVSRLAAGSYTLRITPTVATVACGTTLSLSTVTPVTGTQATDSAGSTLATARDIGTPGTAPQQFADWVGPADPHDFYQFSLAAPSLVHLVLAGVTAPATLTLDGGTGQRIAGATASATTNASRDQLLAAGTYFIDVAGSAATGTNLSVSATPVPASAYGTIATALAVGTLGSTPQSFSGAVVSLAPDNFYSFVLASPATVALQLSELATGTYVTLLDGFSARIDTAYGSATADAWLLRYLPAGTYTVDVTDTNGDTNYRLTMTGTPSGDAGGTSFDAAASIGVLAPASVAQGDLNGDGVSDVLWRNAAAGVVVAWTMTNGTASGGSALLGDPGWTLAGVADVTGSGTADLIWRRPATGMVVLWLMRAGSPASASVLPANPASVLAGTGDFNGDGTADLLWCSNATGAVTEWSMGNGAAVATRALTSDASWIVAGTGDFNGDGTADILWRNSATGEVQGRLMGGGVATRTVSLRNDPAWMVAGTGDFNDDGTTDILWRNLVTGATGMWLMSDGAMASSSVLKEDPAWQVAGTGDYSGDGTTDILWRNAVTGTAVEWLMANGTAGSAVGLLSDPGWRLATQAPPARPPLDLDGDFRSDLVWTNTTTGTVMAWIMNGAASASTAALPVSSGWSIAGAGDFDGDGHTDLLWRQAGTGQVVEWQMHGTTASAMVQLSGDVAMTLLGTGDFDGDGRSDILWRNASTGVVSEWQMNGLTRVSTTVLQADRSWVLAGTGDFNGDGKTDILWRNPTSGAVVEWLMDGNGVASATTLRQAPSWTVAGAGDFNGDGMADILWRNTTTGEVTEWLMNGATVAGTISLRTDPAWSVAALGDYNGDGTTDIIWRNAGTGESVQWLMTNGHLATATSLLTGTAWSCPAALLHGA